MKLELRKKEQFSKQPAAKEITCVQNSSIFQDLQILTDSSILANINHDGKNHYLLKSKGIDEKSSKQTNKQTNKQKQKHHQISNMMHFLLR